MIVEIIKWATIAMLAVMTFVHFAMNIKSYPRSSGGFLLFIYINSLVVLMGIIFVRDSADETMFVAAFF